MRLEYTDLEARAYLERMRWGKRIICPHCDSLRISRFTDGVLYFCSDCRQQFSVTVGTVMEGTHVSLDRWLHAMKLFQETNGAVDTTELTRTINVSPKTARRLISILDSAIGSDEFWKPLKLRKVREPRPLRKKREKLILSAYRGRNDIAFKNILKLYVPEGSTIADVTYGRGKFWTLVDQSKYTVLATDIMDGVDFTDLPYENESMDCVVLDPPYMNITNGTAYENHTDFSDRYKVNMPHHDAKRGHEALLELYYEGADEAYRVLKKRGILVVKTMDEFAGSRQRLTHVEIVNHLCAHGYEVEDLFVVMRYDTPTLSSKTMQKHARKNHSYFLVFRKKTVRRKR